MREGPRAAESGASRRTGLLDYTDRLRSMALNDARAAVTCDLDQRTLALVRIAALVAVGGAIPSYGELADAAVDAVGGGIFDH